MLDPDVSLASRLWRNKEPCARQSLHDLPPMVGWWPSTARPTSVVVSQTGPARQEQMLKVAKSLGIGTGTVQRIARELAEGR